MGILVPDILNDVRDLPMASVGVMVGLGFLLWISGWWLHRFWITLLATVLGGLAGLRLGPHWGVQPAIIAGVLSALAAGCLALSLARLGLFVLYGYMSWEATQALAPGAVPPLIAFTVGGLASVLLFRFCIMLLTSALGTLLLTYGGLVGAELAFGVEAVKPALAQPVVTHGVMALICVFGGFCQVKLSRRPAKSSEANRLASARAGIEVTTAELEALTNPRQPGWFRKAG